MALTELPENAAPAGAGLQAAEREGFDPLQIAKSTLLGTPHLQPDSTNVRLGSASGCFRPPWHALCVGKAAGQSRPGGKEMLQQSVPLGLKQPLPASPKMIDTSCAPPLSLLSAARRCAMREMAQAPACSCCESLLQHILLCLGSTFFYDDDPIRLWRALARKDRALVTPRMMAACIVLQGRERQALYPALSPASWPALHLLVGLAPSTDQKEGFPVARTEGSTSAAPEDLLATVQRLIAEARQRSDLGTNDRIKKTLAYLWAAADSLEGRS